MTLLGYRQLMVFINFAFVVENQLNSYSSVNRISHLKSISQRSESQRIMKVI